MFIFRKVSTATINFFQNYHLQLLFISLFSLIVTAFLHFELTKNNRDLIYWQNLFQRCYQEMEHFALFLIMSILLFKLLMIILILMMNGPSLDWYDQLSQLEVKKRYADFLFLRLIANIDSIEAKYLRNDRSNEAIALKAFIMAHEDMSRTIAMFRKDARKLLTPNETEITMPLEDVYGPMEEEESFLRKSKFYNMDIRADNDMIKKLINP